MWIGSPLNRNILSPVLEINKCRDLTFISKASGEALSASTELSSEELLESFVPIVDAAMFVIDVLIGLDAMLFLCGATLKPDVMPNMAKSVRKEVFILEKLVDIKRCG